MKVQLWYFCIAKLLRDTSNLFELSNLSAIFVTLISVKNQLRWQISSVHGSRIDKIHIEAVHKKKKPFKCEICNQTFHTCISSWRAKSMPNQIPRFIKKEETVSMWNLRSLPLLCCKLILIFIRLGILNLKHWEEAVLNLWQSI